MFVDSHAHLFLKDFREDLDEVLHRAAEAGVRAVVVPGTDLETSREAIALAERYPALYACVGFHPHDASKAGREALDEIEALCRHPKVVAIGEIGLDYHYMFSSPETQREIFSRQIGIAQRHALPIVIHSREAEDDTLRIVRDALAEAPSWRSGSDGHAAPRGVFHCFPGDTAMAHLVIGWGFFISIPGLVTFGHKPQRPNPMVEVVSKIPVDHILLETDSPYLTPAPHRGKRNEPANIPLIASAIAGLKGLPVADVARATSAGAKKLFGLGG